MHYQKTIFLIDDDSDDQEIFSSALKRSDESMNCVFANDGILALEKINSESAFIPDFIFIDLNMPRMNGQECLASIKKIERLKHVPVYMYSTSADPSTIAANKELGAIDFIVKPTSISDLTKLLSNLIKGQKLLLGLAMIFMTCIPQKLFAQKKVIPPVSKLKKLSVEELMNIEVTSVSKTPQKITEVASAIQVLTGEDIKRSPATLLPEVLRLASNLQVTRSGSHDWSVTARGFNGFPIANSSLSNKLLVTVDGRVAYNPLFGGVYWDVQNIMKDDIDRIEIVSGPGGTLWGANAVNGVINIISKSAKETQGFSGGVSYGTFLRDGFGLRYGSHVDSTFFFRLYANHFDFENTKLKDGTDAMDDWNMTKTGFRMDLIPAGKNKFTLQGDLYFGNEDRPDSAATLVNGQNLLGRWTHTFSEHSNLTVQAYFDRTWRNIKVSKSKYETNTFDIDVQQGFRIGKRNNILCGIGYRTINDIVGDTANVFTPSSRVLPLYSGFIQDQLTLIPKRLELTIGTKLLHNYYTDFEWQPSIRLAYTGNINTVWGAISRAVRTPSRFDVDVTSFSGVDHPFRSEKVIAYELGYRIRPKDNMSFSLALFYNDYKDLRSLNTTPVPNLLVFANDLKAHTMGAEFSGNYVFSKWWRVRGGFTWLYEKFDSTSTSVYPDNEKLEAIDPKFQCMLQSIMDLPKNLEFDALARYVDNLEGSDVFFIKRVHGYFSLDVRFGWNYKAISLSVSIQNLTDNYHIEYEKSELPNQYATRKIPRSIHGRIGFRF